MAIAKVKKTAKPVKEEEKKKCCARCSRQKSLKEFPTRKDRKGNTIIHSYCRTCKSTYENTMRVNAAMRKLHDGQVEGLPTNGDDEITIYEEGTELLIATVGSPTLHFEDEEHVYELTLSDEGRRALVIALGGVWIEPPRA